MDIAIVLSKMRPNSIWSLNNNDYDSLVWKSKDPKPTYKEIEKAEKDFLKIFEKEKMSELRRKAYQEESDPLFFEYQRGDIEKSEWLEKIEEIKKRYPLSGNSQA